MVDPGPVMAVPLRLGLVAVDLDGQGVHVERDAGMPRAAILGTQVATGEFERGFTQDLEVSGARQHRGAAGQRWLGRQPDLSHERRQTSPGADRQAHGGIVPERVGIVVVAPPLGRQQHHGLKQRRQVMDDIGPAAIVRHLCRHPRDDPGGIEHFALQDGARIAAQPFRTRFDGQRSVEPGGDRS